ncbi:hypothetical protein I5U67_07105 [Stenotrophomonas maltophilia]|uniref:Uncharacterized protein n=2 Tax=Lysobacteraceae TaxID=32033 RepID=A0A2J0SN37_STEMA|nr:MULTISPECIES: hypothetical protein [Stenotrophomonas]MBS3726321.1 hypothetical protein [Stenotrophomonas sp. PE591]AWB78938.1 hypothetical protein B7H26_13800 [Stenotrophomonas maltophilia]ELC7363465.1 hypothetical protein [Stenotrophomonas maltophilia]ELF4107230.1 hypothetical protein [Stenotrophomonas maltophilia]ELK2665701.1 hypothetical protein [Stenotrophomonas maltophilia]
MMELPLVSLPDLPMATRKAPAKKAATKKAVKRTLDDVKDVTHAKPRRASKAASVPIARIPEHLLLGPGDYPERKSYFDYDDSQKAGSVGGKRVHMVMPRSVTLHDYRRREDGLRHHRAMVTIPPKLRENIAKLFGFDDSEDAGSEVALTTAMVALADYAAASLIKDKTLLIVSSPEDEHAEDRKAARVAVRNLGMSKNGKIY